MTGVVTVVVSHVKRKAWVPDLVRASGAEGVFEDDGTLGEWANHERALRWAVATAAEKTLSHILVIQDDAVPVEMFRTQVAALASLRPDDMIGLYVGTHRPHNEAVGDACRRADELDAMFLSHHNLCWGVATLIPVAYVDPMLAVAAKSKRPYDTRLGRAWADVRGEEKPVLYTWPSLVDHRDEVSVIAGRGRPEGARVARRTGPLTGDPNVVVPIVTATSGRARRNRKIAAT